MKKLLLKRFYLQNKNVVKTLLLYTLVITISMCFSTILLVIYDNKVTQYYQSSYDYMLRYFDDNIIELLEENEHIKDTYKVGIYNYEMKHRNKSESVEVFYVPYWDEEGLTYLSDKRKVKGSISNDENSIMIDALLAHELNVDIGDIVYVKNNGKDIPFKINVIIEPFG